MHDAKSDEVFANGSLMNGKEESIMREVAFEKNPSEPMVNGQAASNTSDSHIGGDKTKKNFIWARDAKILCQTLYIYI